MKDLLEASLLLRTYRSITNIFLNSLTYKIINIVLNMYRNSITNKLLEKYLLRSSSLGDSITSKVLSNLYKAIDAKWDWLYKFMYRDIKNSCVLGVFHKALLHTGGQTLLSISLLLFTFGYSVTSLILGLFSNIRVVISVSGLIISGLLLISPSRWKSCFSNSLFVNIFSYIFD